jgi:hypothetical protein
MVERTAQAPRAAELVATLWRGEPPSMSAAGPAAAERRGGLLAALARLAARADGLARRAPAAERPALQLLVETARAIGAVLGTTDSVPAPAPRAVADAGGALASPARLRLARMERWLAARAASDLGAEPAADLCLWALEHLEAEDT